MSFRRLRLGCQIAQEPESKPEAVGASGMDMTGRTLWEAISERRNSGSPSLLAVIENNERVRPVTNLIRVVTILVGQQLSPLFRSVFGGGAVCAHCAY